MASFVSALSTDNSLSSAGFSLVLASSTATRRKIGDWLSSLGQTAEFLGSVDALLSHPRLACVAVVMIQVTEESAFNACRQLRAQPETAHVPLVVLAGSSVWQRAAYEMGVEAAFLRMTHHAEILARLRSLLSHRQHWRQVMEQRVQESEQRHEQLHSVFRRYVSPQLMEPILSKLGASELQVGTRRQAAVLFADMRGFTRMSEQLPASQVFELLNDYFAVLTAAAFKHDGTVFNMAGDSLMVGFGVPMAQADAGARALKAGRDMLAGFAQLAAQWKTLYGVQTGLGVGINQGEVMAGNIGSAQYMNYSLIGDTVNVAARLSQRARAGEVLFSGALQVALAPQDQDPNVMALPPLTLRGRLTPIDIYCVPTEQRVELSTTP